MGKNGFVGTVPYMAPEMLIADSTFGLKVDSYGFACIIFETLAVKIPWHGVGQKQVVANVVNQRKRPEIPEAKRQLIDREPELQRLEQLMARCWAQSAHVRSSVSRRCGEISTFEGYSPDSSCTRGSALSSLRGLLQMHVG